MSNKLTPFRSNLINQPFVASRGSTLFDDFFNLFEGENNMSNNSRQTWLPAFDIVDEKDSLVIKADLPGIKEDDLAVEVNNNLLTVSGQRYSEDKSEHNGYYRVERSQGKFSRSIKLPEDIDQEDIKADYKDGVLEIQAAKSESKSQSFKIAVNKKTEPQLSEDSQQKKDKK
jgi:HSP20 family protein